MDIELKGKIYRDVVEVELVTDTIENRSSLHITKRYDDKGPNSRYEFISGPYQELAELLEECRRQKIATGNRSTD